MEDTKIRVTKQVRAEEAESIRKISGKENKRGNGVG